MLKASAGAAPLHTRASWMKLSDLVPSCKEYQGTIVWFGHPVASYRVPKFEVSAVTQQENISDGSVVTVSLHLTSRFGSFDR